MCLPIFGGCGDSCGTPARLVRRSRPPVGLTPLHFVAGCPRKVTASLATARRFFFSLLLLNCRSDGPGCWKTQQRCSSPPPIDQSLRGRCGGSSHSCSRSSARSVSRPVQRRRSRPPRQIRRRGEQHRSGRKHALGSQPKIWRVRRRAYQPKPLRASGKSVRVTTESHWLRVLPQNQERVLLVR